MTDREMLELAAKAAGLQLDRRCPNTRYRQKTDVLPEWIYWNPLTDDGDAFRLAAQLRIAIKPGKRPEDGTTAVPTTYRAVRSETTFIGGDVGLQMRRVIVMVAAGIGREMQETTS